MEAGRSFWRHGARKIAQVCARSALAGALAQPLGVDLPEREPVQVLLFQLRRAPRVVRERFLGAVSQRLQPRLVQLLQLAEQLVLGEVAGRYSQTGYCDACVVFG